MERELKPANQIAEKCVEHLGIVMAGDRPETAFHKVCTVAKFIRARDAEWRATSVPASEVRRVAKELRTMGDSEGKPHTYYTASRLVLSLLPQPETESEVK